MTCYLQKDCQKFKRGDCTENKFCPKLFKIDHLLSAGLLEEVQKYHIDLYVDSDGTDREKFVQLKEIETNIVQFVEKGSQLYLFSKQCGNGKTAWAIRLLQVYIKNIWYKCTLDCHILFINVPKFLLALKDNITEKSEYVQYIKDNIFSADLVVWDEIGTKAATTFEHEHLLSMINYRIMSGKSNIYTSNLYPAELTEVLGDRLYSRIINTSFLIELEGQDKRGLTV